MSFSVDRRTFAASGMLSAIFMTAPNLVRAQDAAPASSYLKIPKVAPTTDGYVEVLEFFSYACPHCYAFEADLEVWEKALPSHVRFRRMPAPFLFNFKNFQRIYFSLEAMGKIPAMQARIFRAVHEERVPFQDILEIRAFMARNGVDDEKFAAMFESFSIINKVTQVARAMDAYKIDQVPVIAVNGEYLTSPGRAGGHRQALQVASQLIEMSRKRA